MTAYLSRFLIPFQGILIFLDSSIDPRVTLGSESHLCCLFFLFPNEETEAQKVKWLM